MTGTAFLEAGSHSFYFDLESAISQSLLKLSILARGPNGQHTFGPERGTKIGETGVAIKAIIVRCRKGCRTVVDIQQDRIKTLSTGAERHRDVANLDANALVLKRMFCERSERPAVP